MKKTIIALLICSSFLTINTISAQKKGKKSFAGTVTYKISYEGDIDPQKIAQLPTKQTTSVFENNTRSAYPGIPQYIISLGDSCKQIILFDIPGSQIAVISNKDEVLENLGNWNYTYEKTSDSKTICGYVCSGYKITITDKEDEASEAQTVITYTTTEIGLNSAINSTSTPGLEGFPLYSQVNANGIIRTIEATEVKKAKVSIVDFMIPTSYKTMTMSQLKELQQQSSDDDDDDF